MSDTLPSTFMVLKNPHCPQILSSQRVAVPMSDFQSSLSSNICTAIISQPTIYLSHHSIRKYSINNYNYAIQYRYKEDQHQHIFICQEIGQTAALLLRKICSSHRNEFIKKALLCFKKSSGLNHFGKVGC
jgi:hypothetical protein